MPYQHFTSDDRDLLQLLFYAGVSIPAIAGRMLKHRSSIYRELTRNRAAPQYISGRAQKASQNRRTVSRPQPKLQDACLMAEVEKRIRLDHSPEQISGRLRLEYPDDPRWRISHETIYRHVYLRIHDGDTDLRQHLRHGRKWRRKRLSHKDKRGLIPNRTFIDDRPRLVDDKIRLGDWEGDTIEGAGKQGYIGTYAERSSKYLLAFHLEHKNANLMAQGTGRSFSPLPPRAKRTITVDSGKEFAAHENIARLTGARIYFAHPYHSWERGLSEHTNGLLRQYFPKRMSFLNLSEKDLARAVERINNRPRKILNYRTPAEEFHRSLVALRI
jgi:IS30 family transposase